MDLFRNTSTQSFDVADAVISHYGRTKFREVDHRFEYKMTNPNRGFALIFNHEHFTHTRRRFGTQKDRERLEISFNRLGFQTMIFDDFTYQQIEDELRKVSEMDHSENDCLVVVIMTHGHKTTLHSSDREYKTEIITPFFNDENCPTLKGKPRMFFIQACRGDYEDSGHGVHRTEESKYQLKRILSHSDAAPDDGPKRSIDEDSIHDPPAFKDFLVIRSNVPNYKSYRSPQNGSWFMQDLCQELDVNGTTHDIMSLLTHVNLAQSERESSDGKKKQTLCISSRLTKILRLDLKTRDARYRRQTSQQIF
jgi:caspase 7